MGGGGKGECFRGAGTGTGTFIGSSTLVSFETFLGGASGLFSASGLGLTGLGGGRGLESPPEVLLANGIGRGGLSGEGDSLFSLYMIKMREKLTLADHSSYVHGITISLILIQKSRYITLNIIVSSI